jgi:hypothetical protein
MRRFRLATILLGLSAFVPFSMARADDDSLGIPDDPAAVKKIPKTMELPRDAGSAQQAARERWKPWDREDKPGPKRPSESSAPSSVMNPVSARQTTAKQDEPLRPVPREGLNRTTPTAVPPNVGSPTVNRLPVDNSLMTPPVHPPTAELEVFPAPARIDGTNWELPLTPPMLGDAISPFLAANNPQFRRAIVHRLGASRFKIADNNSPLPDQRGLASFNTFSQPFDQPGRLYKSTGGFEFVGWNRKASLDVRAGIGLYTSEEDGSTTFATNPSAVVKVMFLERESLKLTGGLGVSFPNGDTPEGATHTDFIFSPFIGWVWASAASSWFLHGFEQFDIPANDDGYRLQSDVGVGYWIRRNDPTRLVTALAPTAELHLYTPFDSSPGGDSEGLPSDHALNATLGLTMFFGPADSLAIGVGLPLLGGRQYEWEGHLHFVHRF